MLIRERLFIVNYQKSINRTTRPSAANGNTLLIDGTAYVPMHVRDLESFRKWCRSDKYPKRGDFCWLGDILWVDLSREDAPTHGLVKSAVAAVLHQICKSDASGEVYIDAMRVSHPDADMSCEPDVMFISFDSFESGTVREIAGKAEGSVVEFEGSPDLVVEILSNSSELKDFKLLPARLFAAGVKEYWLIDARRDDVTFEIFRRGFRRFVKSAARAGLVKSAVFARSFRLLRTTNDRGRPSYELKYGQEGIDNANS